MVQRRGYFLAHPYNAVYEIQKQRNFPFDTIAEYLLKKNPYAKVTHEGNRVICTGMHNDLEWTITAILRIQTRGRDGRIYDKYDFHINGHSVHEAVYQLAAD